MQHLVTPNPAPMPVSKLSSLRPQKGSLLRLRAPARSHVPALDTLSATPAGGGEQRSFKVYEPLAAFQLVDELEHLSARSIEPLPFYAPKFLVPGMPRLDDRQLRLLVARDEGYERSRLRLLLPFSVEATGLFRGPRCVRAWTHPFGPRGTIPLDHDDPAGTVASLFDALKAAQPELPDLLVIPDLRLDGPVAQLLLAAAGERNLALRIVERRKRACLDAAGAAQAFLTGALSARRRRELSRLRRRLAERGDVRFEIAHSQRHLREAVEEFLSLEASGWKGRARSALLNDRYRAAFAREALDGLAAQGRVRVYSLKLNDRAIASAVVLVTGGQAVLWKIGYDETFASVSPGFQLLASASEAMLRDPDIAFVDSCAVPDHTLVNRLWRDRVEIGTLVIGLSADAERKVERASAGISRMRRASAAGWRLRGAIKSLIGRS